MGIMTVTLSQWFSNGGMHTLRGRAGSDQFGALGKIFAGAPTPLDRTVNSTTNDHALRKSAKLCL